MKTIDKIIKYTNPGWLICTLLINTIAGAIALFIVIRKKILTNLKSKT